LSAGPVEDLLAHYGAQFIDRIEAEVHRSPAFAHILGGVWRRDIPLEIWQRVEATATSWRFWCHHPVSASQECQAVGQRI
jgi:hypothetical protein